MQMPRNSRAAPATDLLNCCYIPLARSQDRHVDSDDLTMILLVLERAGGPCHCQPIMSQEIMIMLKLMLTICERNRH